MEKLKPCEGVTINKCECGRYPTLCDNSNLVKVNPVWWVECEVCKIKGKTAQNFCQAIDAWNKRSQTMKELKPCPDCGDVHAEIYHLWDDPETQSVYEDAVKVYCPACGKSTVWYKTDEEATNAWNKRS